MKFNGIDRLAGTGLTDFLGVGVPLVANYHA